MTTSTTRKKTHHRKQLVPSFLLLLAAASILLWDVVTTAGLDLTEEERVAEYHRRGHVWPPLLSEYKPATPGWQELMSRRLYQLDSLGEDDSLPFTKFSGYLCTTYAALIAPNFTEYGWAVTKAPDYVMWPLLKTLHDGLAHAYSIRNNENDHFVSEEETDSLIFEEENPLHAPLLIRNDDLYDWVLQEVQPILEGWVHERLVPNNAYGLRVYRNHSKLHMHVDLAATHVVSAILHVDHDPVSEPWPLVIEDLQGNTHEVCLETGDMLLYESSKMLHGRPRRFDGSWYTGLFLHYYPEGWNYAEEGEAEVFYRMPPNWMEGGGDEENDEVKADASSAAAPPAIQVRDTSLAEPDCGIHEWCAVDEETSFRWAARDLNVQVGEIWNAGGVRRRIPLPDYFFNNDNGHDVHNLRDEEVEDYGHDEEVEHYDHGEEEEVEHYEYGEYNDETTRQDREEL